MVHHNGMRPQDVLILLKIVCKQKNAWQYRDLSAELRIPISEITRSLQRSEQAGLFDAQERKVNRLAMLEFIEHGLKYVFPTRPGEMVNGVPTAHSHPLFAKHIVSELKYVWPHDGGKSRGLKLEPLHRHVPDAVQTDDKLYKLLASIDILRVGRVREIKKALEELKKELA